MEIFWNINGLKNEKMTSLFKLMLLLYVMILRNSVFVRREYSKGPEIKEYLQKAASK